MALLSGILNGYANAQHAPSPLGGWLMGLSVPVIVLVLSKVAGSKWKKGQVAIAKLAAGSAVSLLLLSVWHCSQSIAALTGSPVLLAAPMAIGIDCGLIACEWAIIGES